MTPIRFASFLGDNTTRSAEQLSVCLAELPGIELVFDPSAGRTSNDATDLARSGEYDIIWACGHLLIELIDSGTLVADIVAAPIFAGETAPVYRSVVVARSSIGVETLADCSGLRLAVNESQSWSGHHGLRRHLTEHGLALDMFESIVPTGSHSGSVDALLDGRADIAAIDHTIWDHLVDHGVTERSATSASLMIIDRTRDWPAPPFALRRTLPAATRTAIIDALLSPIVDVDGLSAIVAATTESYAGLRSD